MPLDNLNNTSPNTTAEFQVSGIPFFLRTTVSTSPTEVKFSHVTQRVKVYNVGSSDLLVAATRNGLAGSRHYHISASSGTPYDMDVRVGALWLQGDGGATECQVIAQLTTVRADKANAAPILNLSGANGWDGVG